MTLVRGSVAKEWTDQRLADSTAAAVAGAVDAAAQVGRFEWASRMTDGGIESPFCCYLRIKQRRWFGGGIDAGAADVQGGASVCSCSVGRRIGAVVGL